jgi:hypothetical protein
MAKGRIVTDREKTLISQICLEHPDWYAKQVLPELHKRLGYIKDKEDRYWPGLSTVQKIMADIARRRKEIKDEGAPQDQPWSIGTLEKYPISPEALPTVLKAWVYFQEHISWEDETHPFSIRVAKWVARLYRVIDEMEYLVNTAWVYSIREQATELAGTEMNNLILDITVYEGMSGEEIIENDERFVKIIAGLNLPDDFIEKTRIAMHYDDINIEEGGEA